MSVSYEHRFSGCTVQVKPVSETVKVKVFHPNSELYEKFFLAKDAIDDLACSGTVARSLLTLEKVTEVMIQDIDYHELTPRHVSDILQNLIAPLRMDIFNRVEEYRDYYCAITRELMDDPAISTPCGHRFNYSQAVKWYEGHNQECPNCRQEVTEIKRSESLKAKIVNIQKYRSIPILNFECTPNEERKNVFFAAAKIHKDEGRHEKAVESFKFALEYANRWQDYLPVWIFFMNLEWTPENAEDAAVASILLSSYQVRNNDLNEAFKTLENFLNKGDIHGDIRYTILQAQLQIIVLLGNVSQFLKCLQELIAENRDEDKSKLKTVYRMMLLKAPNEWDLYEFCKNIFDEDERVQILFSGAQKAYRNEQFEVSARLVSTVTAADTPRPFLDMHVELQAIEKFSNSSEVLSARMESLKQGYLSIGDPVSHLKLLKYHYKKDRNANLAEEIFRGSENFKPTSASKWYLRWIDHLLQSDDDNKLPSALGYFFTQDESKVFDVDKKEILERFIKLDREIAVGENRFSVGMLEIMLGNHLIEIGDYEAGLKRCHTGEEALQSAYSAFHLAEARYKADKSKVELITESFMECLNRTIIEAENEEQVSMCIQRIRDVDPKLATLKREDQIQVANEERMMKLQKENERLHGLISTQSDVS